MCCILAFFVFVAVVVTFKEEVLDSFVGRCITAGACRGVSAFDVMKMFV